MRPAVETSELERMTVNYIELCPECEHRARRPAHHERRHSCRLRLVLARLTTDRDAVAARPNRKHAIGVLRG